MLQIISIRRKAHLTIRRFTCAQFDIARLPFKAGITTFYPIRITDHRRKVPHLFVTTVNERLDMGMDTSIKALSFNLG